MTESKRQLMEEYNKNCFGEYRIVCLDTDSITVRSNRTGRVLRVNIDGMRHYSAGWTAVDVLCEHRHCDWQKKSFEHRENGQRNEMVFWQELFIADVELVSKGSGD